MSKISVQMKLNQSSIDNVVNLSELLNMKNKAQITAQALAVYNEIVKAHIEGGEIIIKYNDDKRKNKRLIFI